MVLEFREPSERDYTILDLDSIVRHTTKNQLTDSQYKRLEKLKNQRELNITRNRSIGYENRRLKTELKRLDPIKYEKDEKRINQIEKILADPSRMKYPLSLIDNEAKAILGKGNYVMMVDDGFKPPYNISIKKLLGQKDMAILVLKRYNEKLDKSIEGSTEEIKKEVLEKLSNCVRYNIRALELGYYPDDADPSKGEYPINVIVASDKIKLSVSGV
jgi:hypothetical protein